MQIPYSWIVELTGVTWPAREMANRLTLCGTAAEASEFLEESFENIVVGRIDELAHVEGSDHLQRAVVNTGSETFQVVCGAPNAVKGQKIVFAKIRARLKGFGELKKAKLRGVESYGMICSEAELGITDDHSGIMVLEDGAPLGMPADEHLGLNDYIFKFDLTPNRPDSLSAIGIARDVACLAETQIQRPDYKLLESNQKASDLVKISIDDALACPRYAARIIKGVKIGPSPWWIKRKLLLSGIRPITNVVDITNLVMLEMGHPLHAFDYRRFGRKEVLVRRGKPGERFTTLDKKDHELTPDILLITDGVKGVAAAGVMGGLESEVSSDTTDVLLESAYFDPVTIRKSRLRLGMTSESSIRFEKGTDPNIVPDALERAAYLIQKYAGGEVLGGIVDCYPKKIEPIVIKLRPSRVNAILGTNIHVNRMVKILKGIEFTVIDKEILEVMIPTFRPDITREIDLIEEIARIEGYDKIPAADRNIGPLFTHLHPDDKFRQLLRGTLTAQGFDEIYGSSMGDPNLLKLLEPDKNSIRVLNPIAEDLAVLQNSSLFSLLKAVAHNYAQRNTDLRLFEIGKAFVQSVESGKSPDEIEEIGIALSGKSDDRWFERGREHDFYELKGVIDSLIEKARNPKISYQPTSRHVLEAKLALELRSGGNILGYAGQIEPKIAKAFDIKQPVFAAVLDFKILLDSQQLEPAYEALPRFPAAPRDLAIVVDESVKVGDILDRIREAGGERLESVGLFDLYHSKHIGEGKKSLAFSLIYRSRERSLENEEVVEYQDKIIEYLKKYFSIEIRES